MRVYDRLHRNTAAKEEAGMFRPKTSVYLLAPMVLAVAALSACSSPNASEENLVRQFFRASGLRDNQTLSNFATVSFDPKTEGTVTDFDVTAVSPERTEPLRVIELSKALTEAEAANKSFNEKKKTYQDANMEAIDRVLKAESAGRKLTGKRRTDSGRVDEVARRNGRRGQEGLFSETGSRRIAPDCRDEPDGERVLADTRGRRAQRHARFEGYFGDRDRAGRRWRHEPEELRDDGAACNRKERQGRAPGQVDHH